LDAGGTLIDHDWTWSPDSPTKIVKLIELVTGSTFCLRA
jgi:hypothetical protein